ncbi:MAG: flagellar basal body-associated FliL family protein [Nioella sp.]
MLRLLLPILLMLAGLGGGVVAGRMLSGGTETAAADAPDAPDDHEEDAAEDEGDGHGDPTDADSGYEYLRLNNQFIVPLIRHGSVRSLVVLSLTLEIESGATETVYDREPRLRDALLRVMFAHANVGGFDGSFTSVEAMTPLREGLREAARQVLGEIARDVLITDIVRQDA